MGALAGRWHIAAEVCPSTTQQADIKLHEAQLHIMNFEYLSLQLLGFDQYMASHFNRVMPCLVGNKCHVALHSAKACRYVGVEYVEYFEYFRFKQ